MSFSGVHVAVITPFRGDGTFDPQALNQHLRFLVDSGVHGLVPCGTTGESPTLCRAERVQIIEACLEHAKPKGLKVVAGCGTNSTSHTKELIEEAEAMGVDGTLIVTPYYNKPTPSGLQAHYLHLADHCKQPLILYNVPGRTNVNIPLEVISRLFEHPNIVGIKEASGSYSYWMGLAKISKAAGRTLLAGDDDAFAAIQSLGGTGIISASANLLPKAYVRLHALMQEAKWEEAYGLQSRLAPVVRALFSETSPAPLKYALHRYYDAPDTLRLPLVGVSDNTKALVDREWERFLREDLA